MPAKFVTWAKFLHLESNRRVFALVNHFPATIERAGKPNITLRKRMQVTRAMWATNAVLVSRCAPRGQVLVLGGTDMGTQYFAGYVTEEALSVDNLFVFLLLLGSFKVPRGRICAGAWRSTCRVRAERSISNHATPSARPGSGRRWARVRA